MTKTAPAVGMLTGLLGLGLAAGCALDADDAAEHRPVFTPDGESIVFMSNRSGGDWELYIARRDGSAARRLTEHEGWDGYADVSPDGKRIVFDRNGEDGKGPFVMNLETGETKPLYEYQHKIAGTRFSPDGKYIVAFEEINDRRDLWLLHPDEGRKLEELTHTPGENEHDAVFSPDGAHLAFAVVLENGSALDVMNLKSRERTRIFETPGYLYGLNWHPGGETLVFNAPDGDDQDLFLINADGSQVTQLTANAVADHLPSWHPDGEQIIFTSEREGSESVHVIDVESRQVHRVQFDFATDR